MGAQSYEDCAQNCAFFGETFIFVATPATTDVNSWPNQCNCVGPLISFCKLPSCC